MNCPSCAAPMTARTVEGHLGTHFEVDFCQPCQAFWFDHLMSLRLSPGATLGLFTMISEQHTAPPPIREPLKCPRCDLGLLLTNDRQRNTPFRYWRCDREHGRFITFFDFLREKDFIRPLSAPQLEQLKQNVQTVTCSSCGAPIDLIHASACPHCGTPISMLDVNQISEMAGQLRQADQARPAVDVDALVAAMKADRARGSGDSVAGVAGVDVGSGLVETGLRVIAAWLSSS